MQRDVKVSYYKTCRSRKEEKASLFGLFSRIKHGDFKQLIEELRSIQSKEEKKSFKTNKIPAFTYSVNCNGNRKQECINDYLGIIGLDYDNVDAPGLLKEKASELDTTLAAFISPGGQGVKVFVRTNADQKDHKIAFKFINDYYQEHLGVESDPSVKDLTRLCLVSYDPEIFINEKSKVFDVNQAIKLEATNQVNLEFLFQFAMLGFYEGNRHSVLVKCSGKANSLGIDKKDVIEYFSKYADSTFSINEITSEVTDIYDRYSEQFNTKSLTTNRLHKNDWLDYNFTSKTKNEIVLSYLRKDIAVNESTLDVFRLDNGKILFDQKLNMSDFIMRLEDSGLKKSEAGYKRLINSDQIRKINPLNLFFQRIQGNPWDGKDRVGDLVKAANLNGDFALNVDLFSRWLCTAYSYALRGIDHDIHFNEFSRVVLILYSQKRGVGKSTFFQKLSMHGEVKMKTGVNGLDIYADFAGAVSKDDRELNSILESKMIVQIDDIDNALISDNGVIRSIISKNTGQNRKLYTDAIKEKEFRGTFCGSTNHRELVRNKDENRYLIFECVDVMNFELLNSIDMLQLWSQIRLMCLKDKDLLVFDPNSLDKVREMAVPYIYLSADDDFISEYFEFDRKGSMSMKEIIKYLNDHYYNLPSLGKLGKMLKTLAPPGEEIRKKINGHNKYRVKNKGI